MSAYGRSDWEALLGCAMGVLLIVFFAWVVFIEIPQGERAA
jgi:hypothetical protein